MPTIVSTIPPLYSIYFQTIDPLLAIAGSLLALTNERKYLHSVAPASILPPKDSKSKSKSKPKPTPTSPIITFLLQQIAALYLYLGLNSALILRVTSEVAVWRVCEGVLAVCDLGHLAGVWYAMRRPGGAGAGGGFWSPGTWRMEDWVNLGILWFGFGLRVGFVWWSSGV